MVTPPLPSGYRVSELLELPDLDGETLLAFFDERGWGDGLPLIAPTPTRVEAMMGPLASKPNDVLAVLPLRRGIVTRRIAAANAVLAGCPNGLLPIFEAVVRILGGGKFNLSGVNPTTHPVAPLVIVHGAVVAEFGFNAGLGSFGPGSRANATLGRAVRLLLIHAAGARPGVGDRSTQGQPAKYTYCVAENQSGTPWETYPASLGITSPSAITVAAVENPHNVHDMESDTPERLLDKFASSVASLGSNHASAIGYEIFIALCPEHAATIAAGKWGRVDVQWYLYERARLPAAVLKEAFHSRMWPRWLRRAADGDLIPMTDRPENYKIFVTGGEGKHSAVLPSFSLAPSSVTEPLEVGGV
jgi:hypothetical protein